jgi:hypothetical protein
VAEQKGTSLPRWPLFSDGLGVFCGLSAGGSGWLAA